MVENEMPSFSDVATSMRKIYFVYVYILASFHFLCCEKSVSRNHFNNLSTL